MKSKCLIDILEEKGYVEVKNCEREDSTGTVKYFVEKYVCIKTKFEKVYNKVVEVACKDEEVIVTQHSKSGKTYYVFIYQGEEAYNYIARRTFITNSIIVDNGLDKLNKLVEPNYVIEPYSKFQHTVRDIVAEKEELEKQMMEKEFEDEVNSFIDSLP